MSNASLVYDGTSIVRIPESMLANGEPTSDQMQGTVLEQLGECASRICYDSLGSDPVTGKRKGRSSALLHAHILEVINLSVYEHSNFTVQFRIPREHQSPSGMLNHLMPFMNRKGVWIENPATFYIEVTVNLRSILEWDRWMLPINITGASSAIKVMMQYWANQLAPQIVKDVVLDDTGNAATLINNSMIKDNRDLSRYQAWITLWLYGSRGFTHEQVRHRFAMSQRSTRYVDESESPYIVHPLILKYLFDERVDSSKQALTKNIMLNAIDADRQAYKHLVNELGDFCEMDGMDKATAKKQGRGAGRGNLGNALASEMLYSAPVIGWEWMLNQRLSRFADAEIRGVYEDVLLELKMSQYGHFFSNYNAIPSPDGMGKVLQLT